MQVPGDTTITPCYAPVAGLAQSGGSRTARTRVPSCQVPDGPGGRECPTSSGLHISGWGRGLFWGGRQGHLSQDVRLRLSLRGKWLRRCEGGAPGGETSYVQRLGGEKDLGSNQGRKGWQLWLECRGPGKMWEGLQGPARLQSLLGSPSGARFILSVVSSHQRGVII